MNHRFWSLPGPRAFLESVESDLGRRQCAVVALPLQSSPGGMDDVEHRMRLRNTEWETFQDEGEDPIDGLWKRFNRERDRRPGSLGRLLEDVGWMECDIVQVLLKDASRFGCWRDFISSYAPSAVARDYWDRTSIVLVTHGIPETELPAPEAGLSVHVAKGIASEFDYRILALFASERRNGASLERRLAVETAVAVGAGDSELLEEIVHARLEEVLCPLPLLQRVVQRRGWSLVSPQSWAVGTHDGDRPSSAWLFATGDVASVQRRVWSAQVAVLLPYVEKCRQTLLPRLTGKVRMPYTRRYGDTDEVIHDISDLEIGELWYLTRGDFDVPQPVRDDLSILRAIRNRLAHGQRVEFEAFQQLLQVRAAAL